MGAQNAEEAQRNSPSERARVVTIRGPNAERFGTAKPPTLADLRKHSAWAWVYCDKWSHHAPVTFVPLMIRWGRNASSDMLRRCAKCTVCGHKGATLQHPGWVDTDFSRSLVSDVWRQRSPLNHRPVLLACFARTFRIVRYWLIPAIKWPMHRTIAPKIFIVIAADRRFLVVNWRAPEKVGD